MSLTLAVVLTACGGGDDGPPASQADFPLEAALTRQFSQNGGTLSHYRDPQGANWALGQSFFVDPDSTFSGTMRKAVTRITMIERNGTRMGGDFLRIYWSAAPFTLHGHETSDGDRGTNPSAGVTGWATYATTGSIPATAKVGASGAWFNYTAVNTSGQPLHDVTVRWSLEPDTDTTARLCLIYRGTVRGSNQAIAENDCYVLRGDGTFTGKAHYSVNVNGTTINFAPSP